MSAIGIDPEVARARSRVAVAARRGDDEGKLRAQSDLAAARLADHIRRTVEAAPPLSLQQREHLAQLLRGDAA